MIAYLTDESARAYWDTVESIDGQTTQSFRTALVEAAIIPKALKACDVPREAIVNRKLHVLVGDSSERRPSKYVASHVCASGLPRGALRRISPSVEIVSPEYLFVRMAAKLSFWETVRLGYELCGTYIVNPSDPARNHREQLTTLAKLRRFLQAIGPIRGSRKAKLALKYVIEKSNSPMETTLTMLLCLPFHYGGYGLPQPQMNHVIKLGKEQAYLLGQSLFICDLYWPFAHYALEYYGREWHTGAQQVAYDARRSGMLQYRGIDIHVVTYEQLETPEDVELLAKLVAKRLGVRLRKPNESCLTARDGLHRYLIGAKSKICVSPSDNEDRIEIPQR
ncbi:MAG: hypothetical protein IJ111_00855 [Eggerthellaceae bacterium]|nr:hypothetical protein [Eggerthellaceae bacterium]